MLQFVLLSILSAVLIAQPGQNGPPRRPHQRPRPRPRPRTRRRRPPRRPRRTPLPRDGHTVQWPDHSDLCPESGGIPKYEGVLPFGEDSEADIYKWVAAMQMCFFDFVNEEMDYNALVSGDGITDDTQVCFDPPDDNDATTNDDYQCHQMNGQAINDDITTLRDYVDIHKQVSELVSFRDYTFRIRGHRTVEVELDLGLGVGYKVGTKIDNSFQESYTFSGDGTLAKRENHAAGKLSAKLLKAGHAQYLHFANAIDNIVDDNGNIPIGYGEKYTYVIDKRVAFVFVVLGVVAILTAISCCLMCKMCKSARKVVYKEVAMESTDAE